MLFGQEMLAEKRYGTARPPHVQSTSKQVDNYFHQNDNILDYEKSCSP